MMINYGTTKNFVVLYDSSFTGSGQPDGVALAQGVLDYCEYDLARLSKLFGNIMPSSLPIKIQLVPGNGGASNDLLNNIYCYCNLSTEPLGLPGLVAAEEAEIFMNQQTKGWIPSWSNGEALSRVCGQILYPNRAWLFCTGDSWLNGVSTSQNPARSNWVDNVFHTDQDYVSIGCGSLFLNYLAYQVKLRWPDIIGAGGPTKNTLAETAEILGVQNPWPNFSTLIETYIPPGTSLPSQPTSLGQSPEPTDDPFPLGAKPLQVPVLFTRHNLADDGTSHTGSLSDSPDIILKNNPVSDPQTTFSTSVSINSDTESDTNVVTGQANYVYVRAWNRGSDASNVFATVYWSPPATLVTPNLWNLIGSAYYPDVPAGSVVEVSDPGIIWPADRVPGAGHYCFVATVGNADAPAPNPSNFATFNDFVDYIYANNNITWRNFNVVFPSLHPSPKPPWNNFTPLPFHITGAWDQPHTFTLETHAELPVKSNLALQVPHWIGNGLEPLPSRMEKYQDTETDPGNLQRLRIPVHPQGSHNLGRIELPAGTVAASHMLVQIPTELHQTPQKIVIRQLYNEHEVGRITWLLLPPHRYE